MYSLIFVNKLGTTIISICVTTWTLMWIPVYVEEDTFIKVFVPFSGA